MYVDCHAPKMCTPHAGSSLWQLSVGALVFAPIRLLTLAPAPSAGHAAASCAEACSRYMPTTATPAALADSSDHDDHDAGALAHGAPETHAFIACKDSSLLCVDVRAGRLIWRLAAACGAAIGLSGAAVDVPLGSLMASLYRVGNPTAYPQTDAGSPSGGRGAGGSCPGSGCADSLESHGERSSPVPLPCVADAVSVPAPAHARLALCSASGAVAVLRVPGASVVAGAQLPAESFSAPVAFDGRIVLGCRDDHLYCLT